MRESPGSPHPQQFRVSYSPSPTERTSQNVEPPVPFPAPLGRPLPPDLRLLPYIVRMVSMFPSHVHNPLRPGLY